jgi:hypothetical protein
VERYVEKKRERRIRNSLRMIRRAYRIVGTRWWPRPQDGYVNSPQTWEEVFPVRRSAARKLADNLKSCSCRCGCGNGRRHWGDQTLQEYRQSLAAIEQFIEAEFLDDSPGQRQIRRRRPWV